MKSYRSKWVDENPEYQTRYYENNKDRLLEYRKGWYNDNIESVIERSSNYYHDNKDSILEKRNIYYNDIKNDSDFLLKRRNYIRIWGSNNPHYIFCRNIVKRSLAHIGTDKKNTTNNLLGYSPGQLRNHLEGLFIDGMSWDNYGDWHIDHIRPISSFQESDKISVINSLDNLQPLWAEDNLKKGNNYNA